MGGTVRLATLLHPCLLLSAPVVLSFAAWSLPISSRALSGYAERSPLTLGVVFVLLLWYGCLLLVAWTGFEVGRSTGPDRNTVSSSRAPGDDRLVLLALTVLATVGLAYSLYITSTRVDIVAELLQGTGNELKTALDGGAGVTTLRYTPAVSAPIAVHLWRHSRIGWLLLALNAALLLVGSLFASRLSVLMALVVYAFLVAAARPTARVRLGRVLVIGFVVFGLFAALNASRNSNYYAGQGVDDPVSANVAQIQSYLASPMQVAVGVAGAIAEGTYPNQYGIARGSQVVVPSFFRSAEDSDQAAEGRENVGSSSRAKPTGTERYGGRVDIASTLTTNSAFADTMSAYGYWGLLMAFPLVGVAAAAVGYFGRHSGSLAAVAGVFGYSIAELWRILMMNGGFVLFLAIVVVACVGVSRRMGSARAPALGSLGRG